MTSPFPHNTQSPLNRQQPNPFPSGQPPSFKTDVNRKKTKKWIEAKQYSYEGDDWGEYDEDDEYNVGPPTGVPEVPPSRPTGLRQQGQGLHDASGGSRNFTGPVPPPGTSLQRTSSFEKGDERRAFSAGTTLSRGYEHDSGQSLSQGGRPEAVDAPLHIETNVPSYPRPRTDTNLTTSSHYDSAGGLPPSATNDTTSRGANQPYANTLTSVASSPVQMRNPTEPTQINAERTVYPPRKSSMSQPNSPTFPPQASPTSSQAHQSSQPVSAVDPGNRPAFVRPADIYKRMEEERARERASQDSSRPSLDSILRPADDRRAASASHRGEPDKPLLQAVDEGVSRESGSTVSENTIQTSSETVTEQKGEYGLQSNHSEVRHPTTTSQYAQGPTGSVPGPLSLPTLEPSTDFGIDFTKPVEGDSQSRIGIQSKMAEELDSPNTTLQHEPSIGLRSVVRQAFDRPEDLKSVPQTPLSQKPSTRSVVDSSVSRSDSDSTSGISPIMSRVPSVGQAAALRMQNIAAASNMKTSPIAEEPGEGRPRYGKSVSSDRVSHQNQNEAFPTPTSVPEHHRSHNAAQQQGSPARTPGVEQSVAYSEPSAAQIAVHSGEDHSTIGQDLKLHSESDRNEQQRQTGSTATVREDLRPNAAIEGPPSGTEDTQRPPLDSQTSFRPKLPGQWESYSATPLDDDYTQGKSSKGTATTSVTYSTNEYEAQPTSSLQDPDMPSLANPLAAVTAAGAAVGEAIKTSMGMSDGAALDDSSAKEDTATRMRDHTYGNILARPPNFARIDSSVSTSPPTPPLNSNANNLDIEHGGRSFQDLDNPEASPRYTPYSADVKQVSEATNNSQPLATVPYLPVELPSASAENDRLTKDIVRSLSPIKESRVSDGSMLASLDEESVNRNSSLLPAEYDSYWAGGRPDGSRYSTIPAEAVTGQTSIKPSPIQSTPGSVVTEQKIGQQRPGLLDKRFSWETCQDGTTNASTGSYVAVPSQESAAADALSVESASSTQHLGLHVVNFEGAEEAVDMPPRLTDPPTVAEMVKTHSEERGTVSAHSAAPSPPIVHMGQGATEHQGFATLSASPPAPDASEQTALRSARLLPFREIAAIPNRDERIKTFNSTRDQFAVMDTGLQGWISATLAAHPEHSSLLSSQPLKIATRVTSGVQGRVAHKTSPSVAKLTNMLSPSVTTTPSSAPLPNAGSTYTTSTPNAPAHTDSSNAGVKKGKEMLQSAGAFGGRAATVGKGLFAKGRSKFRSSTGGDKAPPSVNPASPATFPSFPHRSKSTSATQTQSELNRSKRRRSPFRSSRSASLAVPKASSLPVATASEAIPKQAFKTAARLDRVSNPDAGSATYKRRGRSPFRWRSQPSSTSTLTNAPALPNVFQEVGLGGVPSAPTGSGEITKELSAQSSVDSTFKTFRRLSRSISRRARPKSVIVSKSDLSQSVPQNTHGQSDENSDRRMSYAFGMPLSGPVGPRPLDFGQVSPILSQAPDMWDIPSGGLDEKGHGGQSLDLIDRLGVLPTPTQENFSAEVEGPSLRPKDGLNDVSRDPNQSSEIPELPMPLDLQSKQPFFSKPWPRASEAGDPDLSRRSSLLESIVRHASPALQAIESRRQSKMIESSDNLNLENLDKVQAPNDKHEADLPSQMDDTAIIQAVSKINENPSQTLGVNPEGQWGLSRNSSSSSTHSRESLRAAEQAVPPSLNPSLKCSNSEEGFAIKQSSTPLRSEFSPANVVENVAHFRSHHDTDEASHDRARETTSITAGGSAIDTGDAMAGWIEVSYDEADPRNYTKARSQSRGPEGADESDTTNVQRPLVSGQGIHPETATWTETQNSKGGRHGKDNESTDAIDAPTSLMTFGGLDSEEIARNKSNEVSRHPSTEHLLLDPAISTDEGREAKRWSHGRRSSTQHSVSPIRDDFTELYEVDIAAARRIGDDSPVSGVDRRFLESTNPEEQHDIGPPVPPKSAEQIARMSPRSTGSTTILNPAPPTPEYQLLRPQFPTIRPMSFTPLPRDPAGKPMTEQLNVSTGTAPFKARTAGPSRLSYEQSVYQENNDPDSRKSGSLRRREPIRRGSKPNAVPPGLAARRASSELSSPINDQQGSGTTPYNVLQTLPQIGEVPVSERIANQAQEPLDPERGLSLHSQTAEILQFTELEQHQRSRPRDSAVPSATQINIQPDYVHLRPDNDPRHQDYGGKPQPESQPVDSPIWQQQILPSLRASGEEKKKRQSLLSRLGRQVSNIEARLVVGNGPISSDLAQESPRSASKKAFERSSANTNVDDGKKRRFSSLGKVFARSGNHAGSNNESRHKISQQAYVGQPPQPPVSHPSSDRGNTESAEPSRVSHEPSHESGHDEAGFHPISGYYAPDFTTPEQQTQTNWQGHGLPQTQSSVGQSHDTTQYQPSNRRLMTERQVGLSRFESDRHSSANDHPNNHPAFRNTGSGRDAWNMTGLPSQNQPPNVSSIGADGRHQERPWAITLPIGTEHVNHDHGRRDSIQYASMARQQIIQQHQQYQNRHSVPQEDQGLTSNSHLSYYTANGSTEIVEESERRQPQPRLMIDPADVARQRIVEQDRARALALQQQPNDLRVSGTDEENRHVPAGHLEYRDLTISPSVLPVATPRLSIPTFPTSQPPLYEPHTPASFTSQQDQTQHFVAANVPLPMSPIGGTNYEISSPLLSNARSIDVPLPTTTNYPAPRNYTQSFAESRDRDSSPRVSSPIQNNAFTNPRPPNTFLQPAASTGSRLQREEQMLYNNSQSSPQRSDLVPLRPDFLTYRQRQQDEEPVVMHASSYPGMEWEPRWDE